MKRALVLLTMALVLGAGLPGVAHAQIGNLGIKGGFYFANLSGEDASLGANYGRRTTFSFGGFFTFPLSSNIVLQPEVLLSRRGAKIEPAVPVAGIDETTLEMNYIEVPVLLKISSNSYSGAAPFLLVGGSAAYLLDAKVVSQGANSSDEVDVSSSYEDLDLAAVFGAGVSTGALSLEARYTFGLTNIDASTSGGGPETKHRVFAILAGINF